MIRRASTAQGCRRSGTVPTVGEQVLPALPGEPTATRLDSLVVERQRLAVRVAALERQLADLQQELARIRATLKP